MPDDPLTVAQSAMDALVGVREQVVLPVASFGVGLIPELEEQGWTDEEARRIAECATKETLTHVLRMMFS